MAGIVVTKEQKFALFCERKEWKQAADYVLANHRLADISTDEGKRCIERAVKANNAQLMTAFLDAGLNPRAPLIAAVGNRPAQTSLGLAATCYPESLRAIANSHNFVFEDVKTNLRMMIDAYDTKSNRSANQDGARQCIRFMIDQGVLRPRPGRDSLLAYALSEKASRDFHETLVRYGADMQTAFGGTANPEKSTGISSDLIPRLKERYEHLVEHVNSVERQFLRDWMNKPADDMFEYLAHDPNGAKTFFTLLSGGRADTLMEPGYWAKNGGETAMIRYGRKLRGAVPDSLDYLRDRIDASSAQRDARPAHTGSVTVDYVKGTTTTKALE